MKDAYYFPHFCNARHDRKIKRVRKEFGIEGYGIFFMLLETLRDQTDMKYPMKDIDLLADEFGTSKEKVATVIDRYDLFDIDKQRKFFSPKLLLYLQPYFARKEKAKKAALIRWNRENNTQALPKQISSNANKSKVNKRKEKKKKKTIPKGLGETSSPKPILKYFGEKYKQLTGFIYPCSFKKDTQLVKQLQKLYPKETILDLIDILFEDAESGGWVADKITIGVFKTKVPHYLIKLSKEIRNDNARNVTVKN